MAKGDRRGFVATDLNGEVYAIARWCGVKTKDLGARLGKPEKLPSVENLKQGAARKEEKINMRQE